MRKDQGLGFNAPIVYNRRTRRYYYEQPNYSIDNRSLSDKEIFSLVFASQLLEQFKNLDVFTTFQSTVQKLIDAVEIFTEDANHTLEDKIEFEHVPELKGSEHLEIILRSLSEKIVLQFNHQSFYSENINTYIIHPYYLKEYRNRWYLIGFNEKYGGIRTYGLDRIKSIEQLDEYNFIESEFNAQDYFKNIVGVTALKQEPKEILLSFTKRQSKYLITQPLHDSQEIVEEKEDEIIFKYYLIPTFEFTAQILGWGDQVKVLAPKEYQEKVMNTLQDTLLPV